MRLGQQPAQPGDSVFQAALHALLPPPSSIAPRVVDAARRALTHASHEEERGFSVGDAAHATTAVLQPREERSAEVLVRYADEALPALRRWQALLENIAANPADPKYRRIRVTAPSFAALTCATPARTASGGAARRHASPDECRARVSSVLCDGLGFTASPTGHDVLELVLPHGATHYDEDDDDAACVIMDGGGAHPAVGSSSSSAQLLHAQLEAVELATVAVLDMRALLEQETMALREAHEHSRLVRERGEREAANTQERDALHQTLRAASTGGTGASEAAAAREICAELRAAANEATLGTVDLQRAVEYAQRVVASLSSAEALKLAGRESAAPGSTSSLSEGSDGGESMWQRSAPRVTLFAATDVPPTCIALLTRLVDTLRRSAHAVHTPASLELTVRRSVDAGSQSDVAGAGVALRVTASRADVDHVLATFAANGGASEGMQAVAEQVEALRQDCIATAMQAERKHRRQLADAARRAGSATRRDKGDVGGGERKRELDAVATRVISEIAGLLEEEWHLTGAVGYVAVHRVEGKRLLKEYTAGQLTIDSLYSLRDSTTARVAKLKEDAGGATAAAAAALVASQ